MVSFLFLLACSPHKQIETPIFQPRNIGSVEARYQLLLAYQYWENGDIDNSSIAFYQAHLADRSNESILQMWANAICKLPLTLRKEQWTNMTNKLKYQYSLSCSLSDNS